MPEKKRKGLLSQREVELVNRLEGTNYTAEALRAMNEGFGDTEFAADVASRMGPVGYAPGVVDPSVARYIGVAHNNPLTVGGLHNPAENKTVRRRVPTGFEGQPYYTMHDIEPDTVTALGVDASPEVWGHEYMHRAEPGLSEWGVRMRDAYSARTKKEWDDVVSRYARWENISFEDAEDEFIDRSWSMKREYQDEFKKGARLKKDEMSTLGKVLTPKFLEEFEDYQAQRASYGYAAKNWDKLTARRAKRREAKEKESAKIRSRALADDIRAKNQAIREKAIFDREAQTPLPF